MSEQHGHPLLVISAVAVLAPLISELPIGLRLPTVVLEVVFGIMVGSYALDFIQPTGMVVGLVTRGQHTEVFHEKLEAVGYGLLIPIFFVMSGVRLDLGTLAHGNSLARVPLFLGFFFLVRGGPVLLYRADLNGRDRLALALYSATALPLIVAISAIGMATGHMRPENAAALVGAGMVSVLLFPLTALSLRSRAVLPRPVTSVLRL